MEQPRYISLLKNGKLKQRVDILKEMLSDCVLCPHQCKVNRLKGEEGYCRTLEQAVISGASPHYGEEKELVGVYGSGTIFFSHCNLKCVFCQNYEISYCGQGHEISTKSLAETMIHLQKQGCHNINFVSPSHIVPQIVEAIYFAAKGGLKIPIVYNSGGYDLTDTLNLLDGIIDIYMPDIKFSDDVEAKKYLGVKNYPSIAKEAVREMHRQVGNLKTDNKNIAYKGMIIRHLLLPQNLAGTNEIMQFIANEISKDAYVNLMAQYYPAHKAYEHEALSRRITESEYQNAIQMAIEAGLTNFKTY